VKRKRAVSSAAGSAPQPAPVTFDVIERIRLSWPKRFMTGFPDAISAAESNWSLAVLGHHPSTSQDLDVLEQAQTSLPVMWASFFCPMRDGRTGTDLAISWARLRAPDLLTGLLRIANSRGVYVECLSLSVSRCSAVLRDLFTGEIYLLTDVDPALVPKIRRWMRFCGVLVDLGDGTWNYISAFASVPGDPQVTPEEFLEVARGALSLVGVNPNEIDPSAPHSGLRRFCGVAFPAIHRMLRERPIPEPRRIFAVNTDGERFEPQDAVVTLSESARERLTLALPSAEDFMQNGEYSWGWISRLHTKVYENGEEIGTLNGEGTRFTVSANSPQRFERLLDRLTSLCGERPSIESVTATRPWEKLAHTVSAPEEGVHTMTLATGVPMFDMDLATAKQSLSLFHMRHLQIQLDQEIPALGGVPRSLVRTPEGQTAVEKWLIMAEMYGIPERHSEPTFLDLDPLREELGLRTVSDQIARGPASRPA
jgi:hypothetical protein